MTRNDPMRTGARSDLDGASGLDLDGQRAEIGKA